MLTQSYCIYKQRMKDIWPSDGNWYDVVNADGTSELVNVHQDPSGGSCYSGGHATIADVLLGGLALAAIGGFFWLVYRLLKAIWFMPFGRLIIFGLVAWGLVANWINEAKQDALPPGFPAKLETGMVLSLKDGQSGQIVELKDRDALVRWPAGHIDGEGMVSTHESWDRFSLRDLKQKVRGCGATIGWPVPLSDVTRSAPDAGSWPGANAAASTSTPLPEPTPEVRRATPVQVRRATLIALPHSRVTKQ